MERRLDAGTLGLRGRPNNWSRRVGPRRIEGSPLTRALFDKGVVTRPRTTEEASLPTAELCGPGHPLFDALVDHVIVRTTDDLARGAVLVDPDTETKRP